MAELAGPERLSESVGSPDDNARTDDRVAVARSAEERRLRPPTPRVALLISAAVIVGVILYMGREALGPFIVGLLFVYLLDPVVEFLARRRVPRSLAILLVYALVVVLVWLAAWLTLRPLVDQIRTFVNDLPALIRQVDDLYQHLDLPQQVRDSIDSWIAGLGSGGLNLGVLLPVFTLTAGLVSALFGYLIIPVWAFYLLKDRFELTRSFDRSLPSEWRGDIWAIAEIVEGVFGRWVRAQLLLGLVVGVATFVGLLLLNATVDPIFGRFAVLLAFIAGVLELLPIIGPIIAAVPAVLLAATAGPEAAVAAVVLYVVVQQVENTVLVPKIQGSAVQLHPSAVIFSLVIGGAIAGLLGAILALPVTAAGRDVYRYLFRRLSPTADLPAAVPDQDAAAAELTTSVDTAPIR
jgi:predicted PurR-regulated permease PerM